MKTIVVIIMVSLALACCGLQGFAQGVVYAPLLLFTNGSGSISPFQGGQMLVAGQSYDLQAIPNDGYIFSSWQSVNVFIFSETTLNSDGDLNPPIISTISSPNADYSYQPDLQIILQPVQTLLDVPGVRMITASVGWQANFVPVPEPASLSLFLCGFAGIYILSPVLLVTNNDRLALINRCGCLNFFKLYRGQIRGAL